MTGNIKQHSEIEPVASSVQSLRRRAEDIAWGKAAQSPENIGAMLPEETQQVIHELRVHQIELEMQNEELRRIQMKLDATRARYFDLYDLAPMGYASISEHGLILEANLSAARLLGMARGKLVKQLFTRFIFPEDHRIYYLHLKQLFETHPASPGQVCEPQAYELWMMKNDDSLFRAHLEATVVQDADGAMVCQVIISDITKRKQAEASLQQAYDELEQRVVARTKELQSDITERKCVEKALQESEEKYRSLAASVDSMYLVDSNCTYVFMNEGHKMRFDLPLEEIIGRRYGEFHSESDAMDFAVCINEVCETGKPSIKEHRSEKDGRYFLRTFTPIVSRSPAEEISEVVIVSKDITSNKQAEKHLIETVQQLQETRDTLVQFEKEAAIGRLATGVAHELLNPVSIISSRLQFMKDETLSDQAGESIRICREQLQRIAKISQDLLQSSTIHLKPYVNGDLRDVINLSLKITERRIHEDQICVVYNPSTDAIPVKMETGGISKVMVHIILNACDALLNNNQKRLFITVQYPVAADKPSSVLLIVADNGCGVSEKDMNRIFDPFFTTKDPGKGTGLGLYVCKGIIAEHRGIIRFEKNDMGGTSFIVELPLSGL